MSKIIFTFKSLTYSQRAMNILSRVGIKGVILRLPRAIAEYGCGYGIKVSLYNYSRAYAVLKEKNITPKRVFAAYDDGTYKEIEHDISQ